MFTVFAKLSGILNTPPKAVSHKCSPNSFWQIDFLKTEDFTKFPEHPGNFVNSTEHFSVLLETDTATKP